MTTLKNKNRKRGFTLVEIAIVLVIIGLLLGGVLKGQELINNAKVRSIADRQNSLKGAWYAFIDRFAALPGDFQLAPRYIEQIDETTVGDGSGTVEYKESPIAFAHMTAAGYLRCGTCTVVGSVSPSTTNSMINQYGGIITFFNDSEFYANINGVNGSRLSVHTGSRIPSNILGEVDRKIDDGIANTGDMRFNEHDPHSSGSVGGTATISDNGTGENCLQIFASGGVSAANTTISASEVTEYRVGGTLGAYPDCQASIFM